MKDAFITLGIFVAGLVVVVGVMYAVRSYTTASTPIQVYRPEPGLVCAMATTSDGVALSCVNAGVKP